MASIGIGIGIVKMSAKLLVLVLVLLRRFPKVLVLVLGRNFGIGHLCSPCIRKRLQLQEFYCRNAFL